MNRIALGAVSFLLMAAYYPFSPLPLNGARWAVFAAGPLLLLVARPHELTRTPAHKWLLAFAAWAAVSFFWSPVPVEAVGALLTIAMVLAAFQVGVEAGELKAVFVGAALGLVPSLVLVVLFRAGYTHSIVDLSPPGGLFGDKNALGEVAVLILLGAVVYRLWWAVPVPLGLVLLCDNRGAFFGLAVALVAALWANPRRYLFATALLLLFVGVAVALLAFAHSGTNGFTTVEQRLIVWGDTARNLRWLGHGVGSYWATIVAYAGHPDWRPVHAHNDLLEALYVYGLGCALFVPIFLSLASEGAALVVAGWVGVAMVQSPSSNPAALFIGAVCLGALARGGADLRRAADRR